MHCLHKKLQTLAESKKKKKNADGGHVPPCPPLNPPLLEMGCDLDYSDREAIIARAKPSLFLGGPGHAPPENFENRDCQIRIF